MPLPIISAVNTVEFISAATSRETNKSVVVRYKIAKTILTRLER